MTTAPEQRRDGRTRTRALGVAGGAVAALAVWAIAELGVGVDLQVTPGTDEPQPVGVASVIVASLVAGLAGWGLLAVLERFVRRGPRVWVGLAVAGLLLSMGGPLAGVDTADTVALASMHVAVAAVVIPTLASTARHSSEAEEHTR